MFLSIVHLRERRCALCASVLSPAGGRSFVVDQRGDPVEFSPDRSPEHLQVTITCANGHVNEIEIPGDAAAEESMQTPEDAPIGRDAVYKGETR